jgi:putative ABC transport system permease protein
MDSFMKDVRYGVRTLLKNRTFTLIAALTIGLGIGANTAIFSVVRAVLLLPLPYENPEELVMVWGRMTARNVENFPMSPPILRDMRERSQVLSDLAGVNAFPQAINIEGEAVQVEVAGVTSNFFELMGVEPMLGRDFTAADATPTDTATANTFNPNANPPTVAILSHGFWQQFFGGDLGVLGRSLDLAGNSIEIIGVLPGDFEPLLPSAANVSKNVALWTVPRFDVESWNPANVVFPVVGRLRPGATVQQAQAEMDGLALRVREEVPVFETAGYAVEVAPLHGDLTEQVRPIVLSLLAAVGFVLLIACANVSNLLLVRAASREREMAVRAAMGGSRGRLVRQMLVESLLLASVGGFLGLILAQGGVQALLALQPENLPRLDEVRIDGAVLGYTALAALAAAVIFGLVPALQGSRLQLAESLKDRGKATSASAHKTLRNAVVVVEVALSVVLLVGAGLMLRSFVELQRVDPGFTTEDVLTFNAPIPFARYPTPEGRSLLMERLQTQIAGLPGVTSVSGISPALLQPSAFNSRYGTQEALSDPSFFKQADVKIVQPGFFETAEAQIVEGRAFTRADNADSASVIIVDDKLAELTWPGESAIGKILYTRITTDEPVPLEVVGVVKRLRHATLAEEARETMYFTERYVGSFGNAMWIVRSGENAARLIDAVKAELRTLDPTIPMSDIRMLEDYVVDDVGPTRFALTLIAVFGLTALVLASVGLYGVLSSVVRQRTAEIGVRMAFGAQVGSILGLVVGQGLLLAGAGLVVGLLTAFGVTGLMEGLLVGVAPADPLTFGGTAVLFLLVATVSCVLPARRATRVDPVVALRDE